MSQIQIPVLAATKNREQQAGLPVLISVTILMLPLDGGAMAADPDLRNDIKLPVRRILHSHNWGNFVVGNHGTTNLLHKLIIIELSRAAPFSIMSQTYLAHFVTLRDLPAAKIDLESFRPKMVYRQFYRHAGWPDEIAGKRPIY